jgi:short-subunit dehydrogenase
LDEERQTVDTSVYDPVIFKIQASSYNASKAFLKLFAEAIGNEVKDTNVTITSLMPRATETPFFERVGALDTKVGASKKADPRT